MPLSVGGGLAGAGLEEQSEATQQLGEAAQVEANRNIENQRIIQGNRSANVQMGTMGGMAAGFAAGSQIGWLGGPGGAMVGAAVGGLIGGLMH